MLNRIRNWLINFLFNTKPEKPPKQCVTYANGILIQDCNNPEEYSVVGLDIEENVHRRTDSIYIDGVQYHWYKGVESGRNYMFQNVSVAALC